MSKSLGNVIAPKTIIDKYGIDTMRWWIAAHSVQHSSIPVGNKILESSAEAVQKLRSILKYMNGVIQTKNPSELKVPINNCIDQYMLNCLVKYHDTIYDQFNEYQFNNVVATINNFITNEISAFYLHIVKDRLYCGTTQDYETVKHVINIIYQVVCKTLWPITPFMVEESWSYYDQQQSFYKAHIDPQQSWLNPTVDQAIRIALQIKHDLYQNIKNINPYLIDVTVSMTAYTYEKIKILHPTLEIATAHSDLVDVFQVGSLNVKLNELNDDKNWKIEIFKVDKQICPRCRRFEACNSVVCERCQAVLLEKQFTYSASL